MAVRLVRQAHAIGLRGDDVRDYVGGRLDEEGLGRREEQAVLAPAVTDGIEPTDGFDPGWRYQEGQHRVVCPQSFHGSVNVEAVLVAAITESYFGAGRADPSGGPTTEGAEPLGSVVTPGSAEKTVPQELMKTPNSQYVFPTLRRPVGGL
ncbi:hypothetical protein AB0J35_48620 [Nonomuraea angiospora]|uniref:hypothetical protein n=1 Tax=Nonomuraea angiospora TaxID=46172 RepID=UPI003427CF0F